MAALRSAWLRWKSRHTRADVYLQVNTAFRLPPGTRYATLTDLTAAQAKSAGWSDPAAMSERRAAAWIRREHDVFHRAVACCAAGDWTGASIVSDYGVPAGRVHTVGFGINAVGRPRPRRWDAPRFLFVGREWERKNGAMVVRAFRRVRELHPEARLTLVGEHEPVRELGVRDVGPLDSAAEQDRRRLVELFEESTCLVLPSLLEPFGIAYLEAGAAGVPSIGTRVGGAATAVGPGGLLVDPADERALVSAMLELAEPARARAIAERAVAHASGFTWEHVAARILAALGHQTLK